MNGKQEQQQQLSQENILWFSFDTCDPITPNLGRETSMLPVISDMSTSEKPSTLPATHKKLPALTMVLDPLTLPVIPPPVILEEPLNMSDTIPWLLPGHLQRLFKTSLPSPPSLPTHSEDNVTICAMASAVMSSNRSPNACPKHPQDIILKKHLNLRSQLQTRTCETVKWLSQYHYMTSELVRWIIKS